MAGIASFIPELWAAKLLEHLDKAHVATAFVNREYEGEIRRMGDKVHINQIGGITVKTYNRAQDIADPDAIDTEKQTLTIDQAQYFNFYVNDIDEVQAAGALLDPATQRAAYAVSDKVDQYILTYLATQATAENTIELGAVTDPKKAYEALVKIRTAFAKANVPTGTWQAAVDPAFVGLLLQDDRFVKAGIGEQYSNLQNGFVGRAAGINIFESNNVAEGSVIAAPAFATTFAEQLVEVEAYRPEKKFANAVKGLDVYGIKTLYPEAIIKATFTIGE